MTDLLAHKVRGEGPAVILLHGLFGAAENLGLIARALSDRFTVVSADARNHGRSFHAPTMTYPEMAGDVVRLMDHLGIRRASVLGHSMGGKTAMQVALSHPGRVDRLVVADISPARYDGDRHGHIFEGMRSLDLAALTSREEADAALRAYEPEGAIRSFLLTNLQRAPEGGFRWRINLDAIEAGYRDILDGVSGPPFNGEVLFLKGGDSDYLGADDREKVLALFPRAKVRVIGGTGHWLHADKPDTFNRHVIEFLAAGLS